MSALADVLKSMEIPDNLLSKENHQIAKDQTLNRLLACLKAHLEEADYRSVENAVGTLRAVNDVRRTLQHSGAGRELPVALAKLGILYPSPSSNWGEAWDRIRAKTIEAFGIIREKIRMLSLDSEAS